MASNTAVIEPIATKTLRDRFQPLTIGTSRADDPYDAMNGPRYHTGRSCKQPGCYADAGTAWGPHWCQRHNAERLHHIGQSLAKLSIVIK